MYADRDKSLEAAAFKRQGVKWAGIGHSRDHYLALTSPNRNEPVISYFRLGKTNLCDPREVIDRIAAFGTGGICKNVKHRNTCGVKWLEKFEMLACIRLSS